MDDKRFADSLSPGQVQRVLDHLEEFDGWRDKPASEDGWVAFKGISGWFNISVNINHGGFVNHYENGMSRNYPDHENHLPEKGDLVTLVQVLRFGLDGQGDAVRWIRDIIRANPSRSRIHVFHVEDATKYGLKAAVILQNLRTWLDYNLAAGKNIREGRVWTYNTREDLTGYHPYLNARQIRYQLEKLEDAGALVSKKFYLKGPTDHTLWYSIDEPRFKNLPPRNDKIVKSPDKIVKSMN